MPPPKLINPLFFLISWGADPVLKDEGSYEQWRFQVVGAQKVCTEEAVHSAIVHSIWGEVREMISFLGFDVNLDDILDQSWENDLANSCLVIICNKSFINLLKTKMRKWGNLLVDWSRKYKYLKEKFPDRYQTKGFEGQTFPQNASTYPWSLMRFLYKKARSSLMRNSCLKCWKLKKTAVPPNLPPC